jgi:hypothetical protein
MSHYFKVEESLTEHEMKQVCRKIEGKTEYDYFMEHSNYVLNSNNPHALLGFPLKTLISLVEKNSSVYNRIRYYVKGEYLFTDVYDDVLKAVTMFDNWEKIRLLHVALILRHVTFAKFSSIPVALGNIIYLVFGIVFLIKEFGITNLNDNYNGPDLWAYILVCVILSF